MFKQKFKYKRKRRAIRQKPLELVFRATILLVLSLNQNQAAPNEIVRTSGTKNQEIPAIINPCFYISARRG